MSTKQIIKPLPKHKTIALIAHDHKKRDMLNWALEHQEELKKHTLFATGTTGKLLEETLNLPVHKMLSGPLGGDQQIGAHIAEQKINMMIFFWDPLEPQPHDPDVKALLRLAVLWNIPVASNIASADFLISSPLLNEPYEAKSNDYTDYLNREIS